MGWRKALADGSGPLGARGGNDIETLWKFVGDLDLVKTGITEKGRNIYAVSSSATVPQSAAWSRGKANQPQRRRDRDP